MSKYRNVHRWLILAFIIVFLGFMRGYWSKLSEVSFGHHLHMFSALFWFGLLMAQPWLATRGHLSHHRRSGMIGLFVAGLVVASSILMIPANVERAQGMPEGGFVDATFFYGVTFFDLIAISAFTICVVMAIIRSKRMDDHATWMISTVYCILGPALARLMIMPVGLVYGFEELTFLKVLFVSQPIMLVAIAFTAWRLKTFHPALVLAFATNAAGLLVGWVGSNPFWRAICDAVLLRV